MIGLQPDALREKPGSTTPATHEIMEAASEGLKDKMFSQIKRKINDCWDALMNSIIHEPEVDFLNEIITNLQVGKKNQNNFN